MKRRVRDYIVNLVGLGLLVTTQGLLAGNAGDPFGVTIGLQPASSNAIVQVDFKVLPECVLYSDRLHFLTAEGSEVTPLTMPEPVVLFDKISKKEKKEFTNSFSVTLTRSAFPQDRLVVKYQGCTNGACFAPERRTFALQAGGGFAEVPDEEDSGSTAGAVASVEWTNQLKGFKVVGQQTGYLKSSEFLAFLDRSASGKGGVDDPLGRFKNLGLTATLLFIVLGGFLLNFTPCVLPMIPINLAIIGAGSSARSRTAGFKNGSVYGIGMALAYGVLGLGVVLTGSKFGTLNSSTWFNLLIALVFFVMALGMFDIISIDLSRFSGNVGPQGQAADKGALLRHLMVFIMGVMAALLAGACVAPVVVSVMLLATSLYTKGLIAGLLLPFLLGVGMALPWPFAGAGLTILPKPGKWMKTVKYGFGVLIALFGVYYGHIAYHSYSITASARSPIPSANGSAAAGTSGSVADQANHDFVKALQAAQSQGRPVFVDFHASWCKNCLAMDETVFNQTEVVSRLKDFVVVRYPAEQPNQSPAKQVLDHFGVVGLPTYLVLTSAAK